MTRFTVFHRFSLICSSLSWCCGNSFSMVGCTMWRPNQLKHCLYFVGCKEKHYYLVLWIGQLCFGNNYRMQGHFWSDIIQWPDSSPVEVRLDGSVAHQSFSRIKERVRCIFKWLGGSSVAFTAELPSQLNNISLETTDEPPNQLNLYSFKSGPVFCSLALFWLLLVLRAQLLYAKPKQKSH